MDYRVTDVDDFREINIFGHNVDPRYKAQYPDLPFEKLLQYQFIAPIKMNINMKYLW